MQVDGRDAGIVTDLNARIWQTCPASRTGEPPAGLDLETRSTMGLPRAQGQRSIQIDGLHVPCVFLQTAGDQHGLVFRSWRQGRNVIDAPSKSSARVAAAVAARRN